MGRYNPEVHHRRSIRYQGYDYSQTGSYFLTLCCHGHQCLFGYVANGIMVLNKYGMIAREEWIKSSEIRQEIRLHEFVVMPNHIHGIVEIIDAGVGAPGWSPKKHWGDQPVARNKDEGDQPVAPTGPQSTSVGAMIGGYKSSVTTKINKIRNMQGEPVWQRNFYDHVIRNEESLQNIRNYIRNNPANWSSDKFYNG
jgi:putative transposase